MGKPIEFEHALLMDGDSARVEVGFNPNKAPGIILWCVAGQAFFTSPAKLRELAAAITRAADALEASQRLTFADLKPGEWFRWGNTSAGATAQKISDTAWWKEVERMVHYVAVTDPQLVTRLTATFTEVK